MDNEQQKPSARIIIFPKTPDDIEIDKKRRDCARKLGLPLTASWEEIKAEIDHLVQIDSIIALGFQIPDLEEILRHHR